jgi:hypothetical protein
MIGTKINFKNILAKIKINWQFFTIFHQCYAAPIRNAFDDVESVDHVKPQPFDDNAGNFSMFELQFVKILVTFSVC